MKQSLQSLFTKLLHWPYSTLFVLAFFSLSSIHINAQGTWSAVKKLAPDFSGGGFVLLSDGSVLCKSESGGTDGIGSIYDRLTPNASGNYINGTWSTIAPMNQTRLYYSTQVLKDGRVYVAGGEYGTGGAAGEVYDPLTNSWTNNGPVGSIVSDANSEILDNGKVIQALVSGTLRNTKIYNPSTNTYSTGPTCVGIHNESAWVKLADGSILFIDRQTRNSERFIPSLNQWVADGSLPVDIYDPYGLEAGGALLLPDGRAIFFGSTGHNAIYTPSGNNSAGTWAAAPDFPNKQGTPDAPAAMMVNGKILCAVSPLPKAGNHFPTPTSFYEYDYLSNTFTQVSAPGGGLTVNTSVYATNFIDLPNGQVLYSLQGTNQYYIYTPSGSPIAAGQPVFKKWNLTNSGLYRITGTGFNGISEGASYGDDWQMNTNYPLVRFTLGSNIYYGRTYNWNSTGVQRGLAKDTAYVTLPVGMPSGKYHVSIIANGFKSNSLYITIQAGLAIASTDETGTSDNITSVAQFSPTIKVYPNPASTKTTLNFSIQKTGNVSINLKDASGKLVQIIKSSSMTPGSYSIPIITNNLSKGIYFIKVTTPTEINNTKLVVE